MSTTSTSRVLAFDRVQIKASPFAPHDVRLLDGPFKAAMQRDLTYLLSLEPDRFLHLFRKHAGLEPKAPVYGGWESQGVAGHSLGHYLSACSLAFASTNDARFKERVDYLVSELALCQKERADGYVSAIPEGERIWNEVAQGDIRSQGFDLNGGWVPWYTMHKIFAGLLDACELTGNEEAKTVVMRLADWAIYTTSKLDDEQWQKMLACEHGGMNESLAQLFALTGEQKYLDLSQRFTHKFILEPLSRGDATILPGQHANTQIPKVIGKARQFELTGDAKNRTIAETFWKAVVHEHSYAIGGNSSGEHFGPPRRLSDRLTNETCETCNTYNLLKLTRHLFAWNPDAALMEWAERALYNHILASQNPETGSVCYFVPLEPGGFKTFQTPFDSFSCCVGTGMENHVRYGDSIYFHDQNSLYVNLFIASELQWKDKGVVVRQETDFPTQNTLRLLISTEQPTELTLCVRYPKWTNGAMEIRINGELQPIEGEPGSYVALSREWNTGDIMEISLPMQLREEAMPDNENRVALLYGPLVLAGALGSQDEPKPEIPVFVSDGQPLDEWLQPIVGQSLAFQSEGAGRPQEVAFIPFYQMHGQRYSVYFDVFSPQGWEARQQKYRAEEEHYKELEARTVDFFQPGEMQPERDHNLQSEHSIAGEARGRKWRAATNGGWFSFDLKTSDEPQDLVLTYWGSEGGNRQFDIVVNDDPIAQQTLRDNQPGEFFDVTHALSPDITRGHNHITVRLQAHPGAEAGGLFGARLVKREAAEEEL